MTSSFSLRNQAAARDFTREIWETSPAIAQCPTTAGLFSADEVTGIISRARRGIIRGGAGRIKVRHGPSIVEQNIERWLPGDEVLSWSEYHDQLDAVAEGKDFLITITNAQAMSWGLWWKAASFLDPVWQCLGAIPADFVDLDIFCGRYSLTPFGIHRDNASVFQFVLSGDRSMTVWPEDAIESPPSTTAFSCPRMEVLRASPGESVAYWPSSYWHVGRSDRDISLTLNITAYLHREISDDMLAIFRELIRQGAGEQLIATTQSIDITERGMPSSAIDAVRQGIDSGIADAMYGQRVEVRVSANGFRTMPRPARIHANARGVVKVRRYGLRDVVVRDVGLLRVLIANGYSLEVPDGFNCEFMVESLNHLAVGDVGSLDCSDDMAAHVVQWLMSVFFIAEA